MYFRQKFHMYACIYNKKHVYCEKVRPLRTIIEDYF